MALIDLHVHSKYSKHPAQWFLQRIGTRESYTEIDEVYSLAKSRGMTYVTLTDHNTIEGALQLVERYPDDTFVSMEATTYFPEDGCKIHVLVYNINEGQFREIDRLRTDIYQLRDYLQEEGIVHSVAHATFSINDRLTLDTLQKLILLFDVFEGINGARNPRYNLAWSRTLANLNPENIYALYQKYSIKPFSETPWVKGITGGSDDHAGLFIGQTFTEADCTSLPAFLQAITAKRTYAGGKSGNFKSMAFSIYKIACDFSNSTHKKKARATGPLDIINSLLFENKRPGFRNRLAVRRMKQRKDEKERIFTKFLDGVISDFMQPNQFTIDQKIDRVYENIATMTDDFLAMILASAERDFQQGNINGLLKNFSAILPAAFLAAPFFSTLKHLSLDRDLITQLEKKFVYGNMPTDKRVLWFSDTFQEDNGVADMVRHLATAAQRANRSVKFVISSPDFAPERARPANLLNLPGIYAYTPEWYQPYTLHVASVLKGLERIYQENPDEIVISTPGPIGLLGILAAKLFNIPCIGIYHVDYAKQARELSDELLAEPIGTYTHWIYAMMDRVYVCSSSLLMNFEEWDYDRERVVMLPQGIDAQRFQYHEDCAFLLGKKYAILPGFTLLCPLERMDNAMIGRLIALYREVLLRQPNTNLMLLGDEAKYESLRSAFQHNPRVMFSGPLTTKERAIMYAFGDLLLLPQVNDETWLHTARQAQACGLPIVATHTRAMASLIEESAAGCVLPPFQQAMERWVSAILNVIVVKTHSSEAYRHTRHTASRHIHARYAWEQVLTHIIGPAPEPGSRYSDRPAPVIREALTHSFRKHPARQRLAR